MTLSPTQSTRSFEPQQRQPKKKKPNPIDPLRLDDDVSHFVHLPVEMVDLLLREVVQDQPHMAMVCTLVCKDWHILIMHLRVSSTRSEEAPRDVGTRSFPMEAASRGQLDLLRWARENGCPWDANACEEAAAGGHLEALMWATEHGCPWDRHRVAAAAARGGFLSALEWILPHPEQMDWRIRFRWEADEENVLLQASMGGHVDVLRWLLTDATSGILAENEILDLYKGAAIGNRKRVFKWLRRMKIGTDFWLGNDNPDHQFNEGFYENSPCLVAAERGHLSLLRWLVRKGCCYYSCDLSEAAVAGGHIETLEWIYRERDLLDGEVDMFDRGMETPWLVAIKNGQVPVLMWLAANSPPVPWTELESRLRTGWSTRQEFSYALSTYPDVRAWLETQNCPSTYITALIPP